MRVWAMLHLEFIQPTLRSAQLPNFSTTRADESYPTQSTKCGM